MRGVHSAHGKASGDYVASVGWHGMYMNTMTSKNIAEVIDWHIFLVHVKQLASRALRAGTDFNESLESAMAAATASRVEENKAVPMLGFSSFMSYSNRKVSLPVTRNLREALSQRQELVSMQRSGAALQELLAYKNTLVAAAKKARANAAACRRNSELCTRKKNGGKACLRKA